MLSKRLSTFYATVSIPAYIKKKTYTTKSVCMCFWNNHHRGRSNPKTVQKQII